MPRLRTPHIDSSVLPAITFSDIQFDVTANWRLSNVVLNPDWSKADADGLGGTPLEGIHIASLLIADLHSVHLASLVDAVRRRQPIVRFTTALRVGTVGVVWVEINAVPALLLDDNLGNRKVYRCAARDVTERHRLKQALKHSQKRLLDLVDNSLQGVLVHRGWRVLYANHKIRVLLDWPDGDIDLRAHLPLARHADFVSRTRAVLHHGQDQLRSNGRWIANDGRNVHMDELSRQIAWEGKRAVQTVLVDVTQRQQVQARLERGRAEHRNMVDALPVLVAQIGADFRFQACNPTCVPWFGLEPEEVIGRHIAEVVGSDAFEQALPYLERVMAGRRVSMEERFDLLDRPPRYVYTTLVPREDEGSYVDGFYLLSLDESERRRAAHDRERLLEQFQSGRHLESVGRLAGGVAHDFNNLLLGIIAPIDMILSDAAAPPVWREHLETVQEHAQRAAGLCRQMLAYAGRATIVVEKLDLSTLITEIQDLLRSVVRAEVTVHFDLAPDVPRAEADAGQIQQILIHLIENADEAIQGSGNIWIETGSAGGDSYIQVRDDGPGFDSALQSKILEPFFSTRFAGRGMGLAAVSGMVSSHGGKLHIDSTPSLGATFRASLPACGADAPTGQVKSLEEAMSHGNTILLVDDNPTILNLGSKVLDKAGFQVLVAHDGAEALAIFEQDRDQIAGVVLDLIMPVMGGEQALRALRLLDARVPVLLSSGYAESDRVGELVTSSSVGFLHKPYRPGQLLECLAELGVKLPENA